MKSAVTDDGNVHRGKPGEADRTRGGRREIDDPPANEGSAIIDADDDRTTGVLVGNAYRRAEWKRTMRPGPK